MCASTLTDIFKVIINVDLLGEPHEHPAVQDAANAALDLLAQPGGEAVQNLLIPKIIVGVYAPLNPETPR